MIKNLRFLVFGFGCLIVFDSSVFSYHKNDKPKGSYTLKPFSWLDLSREFVEDALFNYPAISTLAFGAFVGNQLYPEVLPVIGRTVQEHRNAVACLGGALLVGLYVKIKMTDPYDFVSLDSDDDEESLDGLSKFSQSGVRIYRPGAIKTKFSDVAGLVAAKEDLNDLVVFLKDSSKFTSIGARIPKGILLSGSPGNGKTLLARAVAGEVGCPFLYIAASEFIEAIVGAGAARIRHLFSIARDLAPCIIFIDEIDSIGRKRSSHGFGGDSELTQTLNQLLAEMDGFEQEQNPIVIIAATNRIDVLDEALLRPGRFDRKIEIVSPFVKDRMKIIEVHLKKVKAAPTIDIQKIALATTGFSGAELAELINEAAILAVRENAHMVTMHHIDQARDYMILGREVKGMEIEDDEYWVTAIHEAGHALMHVYQSKATPLYKVTITPRGNALGLTHSMNIKEKYSQTQQELEAMIKTALGGSVAEELIFGHRGVGASNDLEKVRMLATSMVMSYGMTEEFKDVSFSEFIHREVHLPDQIATKLHQAVAKVIADCRRATESILVEHKDKLISLAHMLIDQGTVVGSDVYKLCGVQEPSIIYSLQP